MTLLRLMPCLELLNSGRVAFGPDLLPRPGVELCILRTFELINLLLDLVIFTAVIGLWEVIRLRVFLRLAFEMEVVSICFSVATRFSVVPFPKQTFDRFTFLIWSL